MISNLQFTCLQCSAQATMAVSNMQHNGPNIDGAHCTAATLQLLYQCDLQPWGQ